MEYVPLGRTGLRVSSLCFGAISFGGATDEPAAFAMLDAFVAAGGNFIDTADAYTRGASEEIVGRWLRDRGNRDSIVLATKVGMRMDDTPNGVGLSRKHIQDSVRASLRRLQTDYIDLYQTHFADLDTPYEETLGALDDLRRQGIIHYAGTSNHLGGELIEALWAAEKIGVPGYVSIQSHYNLVQRDEVERDLQRLCARHGVGILPFFPLASGFLSGKYRPGETPSDSTRAGMVQRRYVTDQNWRILDAVRAVGEEADASPAAVAIAWLKAKPAVTAPIIGARTLDQLQDNLTAADLTLTADQVRRLDDASAWTDTTTRPPGVPPRR